MYMNVLLFLSSIVLAIFAAHATKLYIYKTDNVFVYFGIVILVLMLLYFLYSQMKGWWDATKNMPDFDAIITDMKNKGDILTDTELEYVPTRPRHTAYRAAVTSTADRVDDADTCVYDTIAA